MILDPKDCSSLALFQVPKPMFLLSGLPHSLLHLFRLAFLPSFLLSLTLPFRGASLILLPHAFCHGPSLEFFSCSLVSQLPLPRWLLSPPESLTKRREKGPFRESFIGPSIAASGVSEKGVFWLILQLN